MAEALISVVVVTYNSGADIAGCLQSLQQAEGVRLEVIVVDNASSDGSADLAERTLPSIRLLRSHSNLGFGGGSNLGFAAATGDVLVTLNPDVRLRPDAWRAWLAAFAADPSLGIAGAKLLFPDGGAIQHAGGVVDYPLATTRHRGYGESDRGQYEEVAEAAFVTGAALAMRRAVWQQTQGFDAAFYPVYYEDVDLCYRARAAGWRVAYVPLAVGIHRTSASLDPASETYFRFFHASRLRFVLKHFSTRQILTEFVPAEGARWRGEMAAADRLGSRAAYRSYWETTMAASEPGESGADLDGLVSELEALWRVRPQPFGSRLPILGPVIARFRSAWNSVSTRWYVEPMLQQQVEFNAGVARAVAALARAADSQRVMSETSLAVMADRLSRMEDRLAALEQRARGD